jgi:hypothetical protein
LIDDQDLLAPDQQPLLDVVAEVEADWRRTIACAADREGGVLAFVATCGLLEVRKVRGTTARLVSRRHEQTRSA